MYQAGPFLSMKSKIPRKSRLLIQGLIFTPLKEKICLSFLHSSHNMRRTKPTEPSKSTPKKMMAKEWATKTTKSDTESKIIKKECPQSSEIKDLSETRWANNKVIHRILQNHVHLLRNLSFSVLDHLKAFLINDQAGAPEPWGYSVVGDSLKEYPYEVNFHSTFN